MTEELAAFAQRAIGVKNPHSMEALEALFNSTPARICVGCNGPRPTIEAWLSFRWDEAMAKDAVWGRVPDDFVQKHGMSIRVKTVCEDKRDYLGHPEKGGLLTEEAEKTLRQKCKMKPQVQVFVTEGLSSMAVMANIPDLLPALMNNLKAAGLDAGPPFFVDFGRVRLLNDVGRVLQPDVAVNLIGERPGLVTQVSLSAYLAYQPKPGHTDAERNCISNIYGKGLNPVEAAAFVTDVVKKMLAQKISGVKLKV